MTKPGPISVHFLLGPLDGTIRTLPERKKLIEIPGTFKGVSVRHRYELLTHRRTVSVIRYRYVETVVSDPGVKRRSL